ncbi:MAG: recombinase family protein [Nocardioides sp.]|uniref:recombinase family protein n=1 Tax=Nocardioides sp. TaxID=35761 RepID=UPI0039E58E67
MTTRHFGYARVSTVNQSLDQQVDALMLAGADRVFSDRLSGLKEDRPGLLSLMEQARDGDTVSVVALDRLGRSTVQVLTTLRDLHQRGICVRSMRENVDFSTPVGQVVAAVMSALAEMELSLIRERAAAAREAARVRGRHTGRPRALTDDQVAMARRMRASGEAIPDIARVLNTSRATIYRAVSDQGAA